MKTPKQLERYFKGVANHRRIQMMFLIASDGELNLGDIADSLGVNFNTIAEHSRRLADAGLINKRYKNREVHHSLSPYGKKMLKTLLEFGRL